MPRLTDDELAVAKVTWKECKNEVLKILEKYKYYDCNHGYSLQIHEEIEKL